MIDQLITRRSIRKYTDEKLSKDQINKILKAAMYAPSANDQQCWQFIILDDHKIMDEIPEVHPGAGPIKGAPLAILVCADYNNPKSIDYLPIDCAVATQNILLASHSMGLGACWLGIYPRENRMAKLKELCNLPEKIMPFSVVAIGHPDEDKETPERFDINKIHNNKW